MTAEEFGLMPDPEFQKRRRTAALHNLAEIVGCQETRQRLGVRLLRACDFSILFIGTAAFPYTR